jgi:hypothetical protein
MIGDAAPPSSSSRHRTIWEKDDNIMKRWSVCGLVALTALVGSYVWAQETKGISWKHGLSFQVRKAGEVAFTKDTQAFGAEVFLDKDLNQLVYIDEKGSLGLGTAGKLQEGPEVKPPLLYHAIEVRVRPVGVEGFGAKEVKKFSSEVFRDPNTDNLVYISESGSLASTPAAGISAPEKTIKDPEWYHGLEVRSARPGRSSSARTPSRSAWRFTRTPTPTS